MYTKVLLFANINFVLKTILFYTCIEQVLPCSRVSHMFKEFHPYEFTGIMVYRNGKDTALSR